MFCLLIKKKDCVIDFVKEISDPERLFLDNFISISTWDSCLTLEIESVRNGVKIIDNKEHDKTYNKTKKLYNDLNNHVGNIGNVDCECSMEE